MNKKDALCPICLKVKNKNDFIVNPSGKYVCSSCFKRLEGYKSDGLNKLEFCKKHGFYIGNNGNSTKCYECIREMREVNCQVCGKNYEYQGEHIGRLSKDEVHLVCNNCLNHIPGPKNGFAAYCHVCNQFIKKNHNFDPCPICGNVGHKIKRKCKHCNNIKIVRNVNSNYCIECEKEISKSDSVKELENILKNKIVKRYYSPYGKCDIVLKPLIQNLDGLRTYGQKTCPGCGRTFTKTSPRHEFCGFCYPIMRCEECGHEFLKQKWTIYNSIMKSIKNGEDRHVHCSTGCASAYTQRKLNRKIIFQTNLDSIPSKLSKEFTEINDFNVEDFQYAGIWVKTDKDKNVLDVMLTNNIFREYIEIKKELNNKKTTKYKYKEMQKIKGGIYFYYITTCKSLDESFRKELEIAMKYNAKYWSPAPGLQTTMFKEFQLQNKE